MPGCEPGDLPEHAYVTSGMVEAPGRGSARSRMFRFVARNLGCLSVLAGWGDLPQIPAGVGQVGGGYHPVGRVFRDPETGKLILVESVDE